MPTILPKTRAIIKRTTISVNNPAEGIQSPTFTTVFDGYLFIEDISNNNKFDKYFDSGLQEAKRFYICFDNDDVDIQNDDIIAFNLSQLGKRNGILDNTLFDYYQAQIKIPIRQGSLPLLFKRHKEAFAISYN